MLMWTLCVKNLVKNVITCVMWLDVALWRASAGAGGRRWWHGGATLAFKISWVLMESGR